MLINFTLRFKGNIIIFYRHFVDFGHFLERITGTLPLNEPYWKPWDSLVEAARPAVWLLQGSALPARPHRSSRRFRWCKLWMNS
jgi:hypothetical protein